MKYCIILLLATLSLNCADNNKPRTLVFEDIEEIDNAHLPRLNTDVNGEVYISYVNQKEDQKSLFHSKLDQGSWSRPNTIATGTDWFVNWADFPSVITYDGSPLAAHWLQETGGSNPYGYHVVGASFVKGQWSEAKRIHKDDSDTEHGFVSLYPIDNRSFIGIWLDGHNTGGSGHGGHDEHGGGAMTLHGSIFIDGEPQNEVEIDSKICDCCTTSMAKTTNGFITAYRDRTDDEIRDISVVRYANGEWKEPKSVHNDGWVINGCPVNGPAIDANGEQVAVSWFTQANDTAKVLLAFSNDEGDTFSDPIRVDQGKPVGRIDIIQNQDGTAWVSWMERVGTKTELRLNLFNRNGEVISKHIAAELSSSRRAGFPQITSTKDGLIAAWTEVGDTYKVRTQKITLK